ncbi:hypothetical protein AMS68_007000 [Peltaster fructicola]|uniref:Phospholipase/carboxylesterase/thioesterase domain-containing protein n=1 Tax=Peltaster fructicola TaxID=286661 RepID=A0A6H0Y3A1_9PEZI|nr:hypothetical protein AMS68_007000 [Peltaster fructicola]
MPGRLPVKEDFPPKLQVTIIPPPGRDAPTNILVLLHGLGDKKEAFERLGQQMRLPETACVCIDGPNRLLDLVGYHWGDDILFDSTTGGLDADAGLKKTTELLKQIVNDSLLGKCEYQLRDIVFLGYGQGGMASLSLALAIFLDASEARFGELGGVISIGAPLPTEATASLINKCKTPILVCAGNDQTSVNPSAVDKLQRNFEYVEISRYRRPGDTMPANRDEMTPVMRFMSRRLLSQKGVLPGSIELS